MTQLILGVFSDTESAEHALTQLEKRQYNPKDISIVMRDDEEKGKMAQKTGAHVGGGILSGAASGGVIGGLTGLLVAAGVIPGLGALFIGGPLVAALGLTGVAATTVSGAATGALAGGVLGALTGLGLSAEEAAEYEESIKQGGILIAVPVREGDDSEVRSVLEEHNADKIRSVQAGNHLHW